jgi:predicted metal-binding protein
MVARVKIEPPVPLFVCRSCRPDGADPRAPRPGSLLAREVERAARALDPEGRIAVLPTHCLARCGRSCAAAVLPHDGRRIAFDQLEPGPAHAEALVRVALSVLEHGRHGADPERLPEGLRAHRCPLDAPDPHGSDRGF